MTSAATPARPPRALPHPRAAPSRETAAARPDREQRPGDRVAAVGEHDTARPARRGGCAAARRPSTPPTALGRAGVAVRLASTAARVKTGSRPRGSGARPRRAARSGPSRQRSRASRSSRATSWRTSTCRRSPASHARRAARRDRLVAADDHVDAAPRAAGRARARGAPTIASSARDRVLERPRRRAAGSCRPRRAAAAARARSVVTPSRSRERLERRALQRASRRSTAKNTMLKNSRLPRRRPRSPGTSRARPGTAPRSPAQPSTTRSRSEKPRTAVRDERRQRPRDERRATSASTVPSTATSPSCVREHEQAEHEEHRRAARPRRGPRGRSLIVAGPGSSAAAEREPGEVDGEEARAVQRVGARRTRARRSRATRPGRGRRSRAARARSACTASQPTASADRERRSPSCCDEQRTACRRGRSPGCWIQSMKPSTSRTATGSLRPASPSSVRASRRRSVEPRSSAKIAAPSVDGDDRAEQQPLERREVEQPRRGEAGDRPR